MEKKNIPFL